MADCSIDVVSKSTGKRSTTPQPAAKEIAHRYDFKGVDAPSSGGRDHPDQGQQRGALQGRPRRPADLAGQRGVSLKSPRGPEAEPRLSGKEYQLDSPSRRGSQPENAKKIAKLIRDEGPKSVKSHIQGDELRVTSKSRDDLQAVQRMLKEADLDVALQFTNYR